MLQGIFLTDLSPLTFTENKKYPPKNKYYTPLILHSDTFALEN